MPTDLTLSIDTWVSIAVGIASLLAYLGLVRPWWKRFKERSTKRQQLLKIEQLEFELKWVKSHSTLPTFKLDAELNCIWVNRALTELLDTDSSSLIGKTWFGRIHHEDLETVVRKWKQARDERSRYRNRQRIWISGEYKQALVTGDPFVFDSEVRQYIGTVELLDER